MQLVQTVPFTAFQKQSVQLPPHGSQVAAVPFAAGTTTWSSSNLLPMTAPLFAECAATQRSGNAHSRLAARRVGRDALASCAGAWVSSATVGVRAGGAGLLRVHRVAQRARLALGVVDVRAAGEALAVLE